MAGFSLFLFLPKMYTKTHEEINIAEHEGALPFFGVVIDSPGGVGLLMETVTAGGSIVVGKSTKSSQWRGNKATQSHDNLT